MNVTWQARLGSATGPVTASGTLPLTVPLGSHVSPQISFTAPATGSRLYLVLSASKPGQGALFRATAEYFNLAASPPARSYTIDDAEQGTDIDQFSYTGAGWSHQSGLTPPGRPYKGTMSTDSTTGDTVSMTFSGTQLRLYGVTGPDGGKATISLDGQPTSAVDFYSPTRAGDVLLWTSPDLSAGNHTLTLQVTGTSDPASTGHQVAVDDADVTGPAPPNLGRVSGKEVDTTTQGNWQGTYGTQGYDIAGDTEQLPAGTSVSTDGALYVWDPAPTDPRALQRASGPGRIAATFYSFTFHITVDVTGGTARRVSFYMLDWDGATTGRLRTESVTASDEFGNTLDEADSGTFTAGEYLSWDVSGQVTFTFNVETGDNAVVGGFFFDPAS